MTERKFVYGLCTPCSESPDRADILQRIEAKFFESSAPVANPFLQ
jgi:hypothetical protein